jgi:hypothetical protein
MCVRICDSYIIMAMKDVLDQLALRLRRTMAKTVLVEGT